VSAEKTILLGKQYGKGLQLVNILRDYPQDLRLGRSYLPVNGALSEDANVAEPIFQEWRSVAQRYLESGAQYVRAIRPIRVRFACALPVLIGIETLGKMRNIPPAGQKIKVSRGRVYRLMVISVLIAAVPGCDKFIMRAKQR
jgi:farnesyl-diphosphate farnesyltransferase